MLVLGGDEVEVKGSLSVPGRVCKPMVQRDDLWRPERYAVFDVESYVGHGLLTFDVDVC